MLDVHQTTPETLDHQAIEAQLRAAGIQPTAQRIAICRYVLHQTDHATVEEVKAWVDQHFPKVSLATVYNTLNLLVQAQMLRPIRLPETDKVRFDSNVMAHAHFLDEATGELYDLPAEAVQVRYRLPPEFAATEADIIIRGQYRG
jgi:Fur family iron response transcriptional regulator